MVLPSDIRSERNMIAQVPDRFKAANAFWIGLSKIGLTPAAVLSQARVPVTVFDGKKNLVTTAQFFALWRAVGELSPDPAEHSDRILSNYHSNDGNRNWG